MLAAFSSPTNEQGLSLRQERYQLASMAPEFLVERKSKAIDLKVLQYGATAELLKRGALGDAEGWDIVHLSGHGAPGVLMFENKSGQAIPVGNRRSTRLARRCRVPSQVLRDTHRAAPQRHR